MNYNTSKHLKIFSIYQNDKKLILEDILKTNYGSIYDSMIEENYVLNVDNCNIFNEIRFKEKVAGFSTYTIINDSHLLLTNIYILPSFRGNKLFNKELSRILEEGYVISIHEPNKIVVTALVNYGYAEKVNDTLVVSAINFNIDIENIVPKNSQLNRDVFLNLTNLYDLDLCASLLFNIENNETFEVHYAISGHEKEKVTLESKDIFNKDYFENIVNILTRRDLEIERRLLLLRENLPSVNLEIKELFSSDLADIFMDYVNEGLVTLNEIKKIKQQLFIDLTRSTIRKQSIPLRLKYLVSNLHNTKEKDDSIKNPCPYCNEELDYSRRYCVSCGYDIFNDVNVKNKNKYLYHDVLTETLSYKYSLNNIIEKKDEFNEEYLISLAICYIIDNLNIKNYYSIFNMAADNYNISNIDLRQFMYKKGYITYDVLESSWSEEGQEFSVSELKNILLKNNIKQSGNKTELIERIKSNISLTKIKSKVPKITELGFQFKEDCKTILYHNKYLKNYVYEEFEEFFASSEKTSINEITLDFLNQHIEKAINLKKHNQLIDSIKLQSQLYSNLQDIEEFLRLELKLFFINLNMLFIDDVYYDFYNPIEESTFNTLRKLKYEYDFEEMFFIISLIYQEFDEKYLHLTLDESSEILKSVLNQNNLDNLNYRIKYNHYPSKIGGYSSSNKKKSIKISSLDSYF
ncbi:SAP domain-containing protein [Methanosphaera sp.]|uniref:SAP domain-containing protein n=1 Tax=Methanosphaera sp. TaxID=2666342 RepID=UPI0025D2E9D7|nr:SAP domain-containing protein [Methanosphaera sp.]